MTNSRDDSQSEPPRLKVIGAAEVASVWQRTTQEYRKEMISEWVREAGEVDAEIKEAQDLPEDIIIGLYPEIAAFGSNGMQVIQALQVFIDIDHYLGGPNLNHKKSLVGEAYQNFYEQLGFWEKGFYFPRDTDEEVIRKRVASSSLRIQLNDPTLKLNVMERAWIHQPIRTTLMKVGKVFATQVPSLKDNRGIRDNTEFFQQKWEALRLDLNQTPLETDMPYFK